jgi:hypothetical protein
MNAAQNEIPSGHIGTEIDGPGKQSAKRQKECKAVILIGVVIEDEGWDNT